MTIQPIIQSVHVKAPPEQAFALFTDHVKDWWKKGSTLGKKPHEDIIFEKKAGGRWFERDADGAEVNWGKVLAFEPPGRLLLAMQINTKFQHDPAMETEVEITFAPAAGGGTLVTLEHRNLERFGQGADPMIAALTAGWKGHVDDFGRYADAHS